MQRIRRRLEIGEPADVVDDREGADVVEQRVDGEVAPEGILFGRAVGVVALNQAIGGTVGGAISRARLQAWLAQPIRRGVLGVGALVVGRFHHAGSVHRLAIAAGFECLGNLGLGRDLGRVDLAPEGRDLDRLGAELDVRKPEAPADDPAVAKQLLDLMRVRRRPDVEILGPTVQEQVADAAADQVRDVMVLVEPVEDLEGAGIDVSAGDRVGRTGYDGRLRHRLAV